jgi:hypothetical protein
MAAHRAAHRHVLADGQHPVGAIGVTLTSRRDGADGATAMVSGPRRQGLDDPEVEDHVAVDEQEGLRSRWGGAAPGVGVVGGGEGGVLDQLMLSPGNHDSIAATWGSR